MTCWKCARELAGHWRSCPACGALSAANVEAVCRGVASMAVRVYVRECRVNGRENVYRANTPGGDGHKHPTRHGAALAAFDAAWEASLPAEERKRRAAVETVDAAARHLAAGFGYRFREAEHWSEKMQAATERVADATEPGPAPKATAVPLYQGPYGDAQLVESRDDETGSSEWFLMQRPKPAPFADQLSRKARDFASVAADRATIAAWCEETRCRWVEHAQAVDLQYGTGRFVGVQWLDEVWQVVSHEALPPLRYLALDDALNRWRDALTECIRIPTHVADAMVREAKRALGGAL